MWIRYGSRRYETSVPSLASLASGGNNVHVITRNEQATFVKKRLDAFSRACLKNGRLANYTCTDFLKIISVLHLNLVALSGVHVIIGRAAREAEQSKCLKLAGIQIDRAIVQIEIGDITKQQADQMIGALCDSKVRPDPDGNREIPVYRKTKANAKLDLQGGLPTVVLTASQRRRYPT